MLNAPTVPSEADTRGAGKQCKQRNNTFYRPIRIFTKAKAPYKNAKTLLQKIWCFYCLHCLPASK